LGSQAPAAEHCSLVEQAPQAPPQPSGPHCLPPQAGTHSQAPAALQVSLSPHFPQLPPHPSVPHCFPAQLGTQLGTHRPSSEHVAVAAHVPHTPPQPSEPQRLPEHRGRQASAPAGGGVVFAPPQAAASRGRAMRRVRTEIVMEFPGLERGCLARDR
jgi:hypothetical protein